MKFYYRASLASTTGPPLFAAFDVTAQGRFYAFMRTTVDLPDPLYKRVKAEAALRGMKLRDFITRALEQALAGSSQKTKSRRVRLPLVQGHGMRQIDPTRGQLDASFWDSAG